jgi:acetyl esterase/lipase
MDQSERLAGALSDAGADVTFVTVPGADHVFAGTDPRPQADAAIAFLADRLERDTSRSARSTASTSSAAAATR